MLSDSEILTDSGIYDGATVHLVIKSAHHVRINCHVIMSAYAQPWNIILTLCELDIFLLYSSITYKFSYPVNTSVRKLKIVEEYPAEERWLWR